MAKIVIDLSDDFDRLRQELTGEIKRATRRKPKQKDKVAERSEAIEMRLMTLETLSDHDRMALEIETIQHVSDMLASGNRKSALSFLNSNKHRFTPEMKDSLVGVVNEGLSDGNGS
jgi:hypothetical protein